VYAGEALAEGRGLLAEFENPGSIARCVNLFLENPVMRSETQERALEYGRKLAWPTVGQRYAEVVRRVAQARGGRLDRLIRRLGGVLPHSSYG
jgi:hypothetical protein